MVDVYFNQKVGELSESFYLKYKFILASKEIGQPEANRVTIEIPGRDGVLDITEALYETTAVYSNRTIKLEFISQEALLKHGYEIDYIFHKIMNEYHGQNVTVVFSDDEDSLWSGFCTVECSIKDKKYVIDMEIEADPYCTSHGEKLL